MHALVWQLASYFKLKPPQASSQLPSKVGAVVGASVLKMPMPKTDFEVISARAVMTRAIVRFLPVGRRG